MESDKVYRILDIYTHLLDAKELNKRELANIYNVDERTIQRDISDIKGYMTDRASKTGSPFNLKYKRSINRYVIENINYSKLDNSEILGICKILLASRAFKKDEMYNILDKLIDSCSTKENSTFIKYLISNEKFHYVELKHKKSFLDTMWQLAKAIESQKQIEVNYFSMYDNKNKNRKLMPLAILFSEYYFYLIAYINREDEDLSNKNIDDMMPIIYRIDRINKLKILDEYYKIPYKDKFEEGEFRKRIQFMQGGKLQKIKFKYNTTQIEAAEDRLPTAKFTKQDDGTYIVEAKVYGRGIQMWLRSQGDLIKEIYN